MNINYKKILNESKHIVDFCDVFGTDPAEWYLACLDKISINKGSGKNEFSRFGSLDKTKGSVQHFLSYFPENPKLKKWANLLLGAV